MICPPIIIIYIIVCSCAINVVCVLLTPRLPAGRGSHIVYARIQPGTGNSGLRVHVGPRYSRLVTTSRHSARMSTTLAFSEFLLAWLR